MFKKDVLEILKVSRLIVLTPFETREIAYIYVYRCRERNVMVEHYRQEYCSVFEH